MATSASLSHQVSDFATNRFDQELLLHLLLNATHSLYLRMTAFKCNNNFGCLEVAFSTNLYFIKIWVFKVEWAYKTIFLGINRNIIF